ncbi:MAG: DUF2336 domain-containing protein [Alphaproteobacteria bacterium]
MNPSLGENSAVYGSGAVMVTPPQRQAFAAQMQADDLADNGRRLIEKLAEAGQLKVGFLIRVLLEGRLELFELGLAKLLDLDYSRVQHLLYESGPRPVAMACRAIGIDRCVFPTIYKLSRQRRCLDARLQPGDRLEIDDVFAAFSKRDASDWLRAC